MPTALNTTVSWSDLTKLSPMLWFKGASVEAEEIRMGMDLWSMEPMDQFNRDFSVIARSGFSHTISEGDQYSEHVTNQGDTLSISVQKRGTAFTITEDLMDGNKYRNIRIGLEDLGGAIIRGIGLDQHHFLLGFPFSSSYTDRDGITKLNGVAKGSEALFDNTHTMADGSTYDNLVGDLPLNEPNFRTGEDLSVDFLDENGLPISWMGDVVVTTKDRTNVHQAMRMFRQDFQTDSAERNMNVYKGMYRHVPLHYAATTASGTNDTANKGKYWAAYSSRLLKDSAVYALHTAPTPRGPFEDPFNGGMLWRSKARYDLGFGMAYVGFGAPATT